MGDDKQLNGDKLSEVAVSFANGDADWEQVMKNSATNCAEKCKSRN